MLVEFGTTRLAGHSPHLGRLHYYFLGLAAYAVAFLKRDAGKRGHVYCERTFVEARQEASAKGEKYYQGRHKQYTDGAEQSFFVAEHIIERTHVCFAENPCGLRLAVQYCHSLAAAEQEAAQHRRECKGNDCGCRKCDQKRYAERYKHPALHTCKEEKRKERGGNDKSGVEYGHTHLRRGVEYHIYGRRPVLRRQRGVLPQAFVHILHIHDGIVHKATDGNGYTAEAHGVYRYSQHIKQQHSNDYGHRQGYNGDKCRAQIHQEEEQHYYNEQSTFEQRSLQIADGVLDKIALAEDIGVYFYIGGQRFLQRSQFAVYILGKLHGAFGRLFGNGYYHRRFGLDRSHAEARQTRALLYCGDVGKSYNSVFVGAYNSLAEFIHVACV